MSIRRYCRIFLRSFDAHFLFLRVEGYLNFTHFGEILSRKSPPYFFAGIRATSCATFRPNTSVGNADRLISCGFARTLNNAGDGDVLCQERYENAEWDNGWVLFVRVDKFGRSVV